MTTYRYREHPLKSDCEEDTELPACIQVRQQAKTKTQAPLLEEPLSCLQDMDFTNEMEIQLEIFPPVGLSDIELVEIKSDDPSVVTSPSYSKATHLKWKRMIPKRGLVVKDVICLPKGHYTAQLERQISPNKNKQVAEALGLTARITIDYNWSASQLESRLGLLFQGRFQRKPGQRFSFTYLQCVQGSRVLFVPDTPLDGWTSEQVLRITGHGPLYILSHHDYPQVESDSSASETQAVNRREFCVGKGSQLVRQIQPHISQTQQKLTLNLDTVLSLFRQENIDVVGKTHIQVTREDALHCAQKAVRKPGFCYKSTPIISFSDNETNSHEEPLREFFRLTMLGIQQSCVFEGRPGRLFLTYNLTALEDRKYYEAGILIGWSLSHGGPGPCCLHPALYQLMCCQNPILENFNWMDIADTEVQMRLQELQCCHDVKLLPPNFCNWVSCCGIPGIHSAQSNEIPAIYARLVKHYIYHRVASMISQFIEGLNSCGGLWHLVKSHWEMFLPVMTSTQQKVLTMEEFKQLFTVCYCHADSQLRTAEEVTVTHWETVLSMVNDGRTDFSLEDLLVFITGADHLPPLGLHKRVSLLFYCQDVNKSILPHTSWSSLELFLPRGVAECMDLLTLLRRALHKSMSQTQWMYEGEEEKCSEVMT